MGVNGGCHACTLAGLLSLCAGNAASPRGPKFGISILCGNGPPFAACQRKIGGFVPARVPPAERGPVFPLRSMTPLILTVDFLSLFLGRSSYFISSLLFKQKSMKNKTKKTDYNRIASEKGSFGYYLLSNRHFFSK